MRPRFRSSEPDAACGLGCSAGASQPAGNSPGYIVCTQTATKEPVFMTAPRFPSSSQTRAAQSTRLDLRVSHEQKHLLEQTAAQPDRP